MITAAEVARAIQGCWRLARLDPSGMDFFDKSIDGFWRSFWAAALTAPVYLMIDSAGYNDQAIVAGSARYYAAEAIAFVIRWIAFPLVMFYVARSIDRAAEYVGYVVAYNWSHLLQVVVFLVVWGLAPNDPAAPSAWLLLLIGASVVVLVYVGFIAKIALRIPAMMAAAVVALDFVLAIFISHIGHVLALGA